MGGLPEVPPCYLLPRTGTRTCYHFGWPRSSRRLGRLRTYKTGPRYTCLLGPKKLILNLFLTDPLTRLRRLTGWRERRLRATLFPNRATGRGVRWF